MKITFLIQRFFEIFLVGIVLLIVFQPDIPFIGYLSDNALWIIIGFVGLGMLFLLFKKSNLVYLSLFSAMALTLFIKDLSNKNLIYSSKNSSSPALNISHYNIFDFKDKKIDLLKIVLKSNSDVVSFEELSPDWNSYLIDNLKDEYPNYSFMNRGGDVDSKLVFSKYDIIDVDTFYLSGHPQLNIAVDFNKESVKLILLSIIPDIGIHGTSLLEKQMNDLSDYVYKDIDDKIPTIVIGEFNQVYWSKNIKSFLSKTKFNNARRYVYLTKCNPYVHIFYSNDLVCLKMDEILDFNSNHLGIEGEFKLLDNARGKSINQLTILDK